MSCGVHFAIISAPRIHLVCVLVWTLCVASSAGLYMNPLAGGSAPSMGAWESWTVLCILFVAVSSASRIWTQHSRHICWVNKWDFLTEYERYIRSSSPREPSSWENTRDKQTAVSAASCGRRWPVTGRGAWIPSVSLSPGRNHRQGSALSPAPVVSEQFL